MLQTSLFNLKDRHQKLNERDPLVLLNQSIEWEAFRDTLEVIRDKSRKSKAGRKPFDVVLMFKSLVLQHLYNLSDKELEFQIRDRYSFCRFLGLQPESPVPDAKTLWLFREQLTRRGLVKVLFEEFDRQLQAKGYRSHIHHRGKRYQPLAEQQKAANKRRSKVRARVEHVFGSIDNEQDGLFVRVIGIVRAETKIGLTNLVYNMRRLTTLSRISVSAA